MVTRGSHRLPLVIILAVKQATAQEAAVRRGLRGKGQRKVCPPPDLPTPGGDPTAGTPGGGSGLNGFPRHRPGGPDVDGVSEATPPAGPVAADDSVDRRLHNLLIGIGVFERILAGLDPTTQAAAFTAATEAHNRLRDAFDAVNRHHAEFDEWSPPGPDEPPT